MKLHFVIRLEKAFKDQLAVHPVHWQDMILDRTKLVESFYPELDRLFKKYHFKFWVAKEYGRHTSGTWTEEELFTGLDCFYRLILQEDYQLPPGFLEELKAVPHVIAARQIDVVATPIPVEKLVQQKSIATGNATELIQLPYAHLRTRGDASVSIAVLDTGVNIDHPELKGRIARHIDFVNLEGLDTSGFIADQHGYDNWPADLVGHGTHVSGILAARGIEMDEGVCPDCRVFAVRVLATMKQGNKLVGAGIVDNINSGIKWAIDNGADIINMSLGIRHTGGGLPHEEVIRYALQKNVTIVAASGNDGTDEKYYPGALPGVIAVGAVDTAGTVTPFTSYGANISVVAPGVNIYSSFTQKGYAFASGTSQASPFVAGAIGLMKSYARKMGRDISHREIQYILKATSDKPDTKLKSVKTGYGLINLADAFKLLENIIRS